MRTTDSRMKQGYNPMQVRKKLRKNRSGLRNNELRISDETSV